MSGELNDTAGAHCLIRLSFSMQEHVPVLEGETNTEDGLQAFVTPGKHAQKRARDYFLW